MVKRFPSMDAWMREAEEALRLIDDMECRVKNKNHDSEQLSSLRDTAKSKLLELGIKLDRLESLLHNPPSKPVLTDVDINLRWKMLADIKLRTRVVALTLLAAPPRNRPDDDAKESDKSSSFYSRGPDMELAKPLINTRPIPFITGSCIRKACWIICIIFGAFALLFALFVLCALI